MNRQAHARCVAGIMDALAKVGIAAVYDQGLSGFLLMRHDDAHDGEDLWERALRAPVLVLSDEELESPHYAEIAWRKASHILRESES